MLDRGPLIDATFGPADLVRTCEPMGSGTSVDPRLNGFQMGLGDIKRFLKQAKRPDLDPISPNLVLLYGVRFRCVGSCTSLTA